MTGGRYARCAGPHPTTTSPSPVTRAAPRAVDPALHPQPLRLRRHSLDTEQNSGQTFTSGSTVKIEPAQPLRHARLPAPQFQARDHRTNKPPHSADDASAKSACTLPEVVTGGGTCTCVKPPYTTSELHRCWPTQYTRNIAANPVPVEAEAAVPREARAAGHRGGAGPAADRGHPAGHSREGVVARVRVRRAAACFAKEMKRRPARWDYQGTERSPRHPPQAVMTTDARSPPAETGGAPSCHQISHDSHRPHRRLRITRLRAGLRDPAGRGAVASAAVPPPGPAESPRDRAMFGRGDGPARAVWRRGAE